MIFEIILVVLGVGSILITWCAANTNRTIDYDGEFVMLVKLSTLDRLRYWRLLGVFRYWIMFVKYVKR